ncbi:MAG: phosphate ABC transporter permease PstA [Actinomycetota bacterium]|nr:phosphate ABC transporter permease PstA [Actinomycetota bacterium]
MKMDLDTDMDVEVESPPLDEEEKAVGGRSDVERRMRERIERTERRAAICDRIATVVIWGLALFGLGILAFIIGTILVRGLTTALTPGFVFGKPEAIREGGGIWPMIVSSFYLALLTIAIAIPLGVGAAIYMAEFAREGWVTRVVRFGADSLSTVPSVVFGIFGMVLFVIYFGLGYSLLAGALTLALLNLPMVMRTTEEALKAVPCSYREASMGLGATRWETVKKVLLPSAMPGITTGAVLTIGRIVGESAAVIYTVGIFIRKVPTSPLSPAAPMAANIWHTYTEGALVSDWMRVANGEAAFLLLVVLVLNLLARLAANRFQKRLGAVK